MSRIVGWRKYSLAAASCAIGAVLCWNHCISGADWVTATSLILGLYKVSNVVDKKLGGAG